MGLFDRVKTTASGIGNSVAKTSGQLLGKATVEVKENAKIAAVKADISAIEAEIDVCYTAIGRAYVETALKGGEICDIGCAQTLKLLEPKLEKKIVLEKELAELEKNLVNSQIMQERHLIQQEIDEAKAKLDKAKNIGALDENEYQQLLSKEMKKLEYFDDIRKIKQQKELGLISEEEMKIKIAAILD